MNKEVEDEVRTQIGTFIFNEYGNPDFRCTASEWLRKHHFIINSVTKSNIVFHGGYHYFNPRGAILINDTIQKSNIGDLLFDPISKTVQKQCRCGQWLIKNGINPEEITINNFKFGFKSDQWNFIDPSSLQDSPKQENNQKQTEVQVVNKKSQNHTYNYQTQPKKLKTQIQARKKIKELQELLNKQQMQYIHQMRELQQMQLDFQLSQVEKLREMQQSLQYQQDDYESSETHEYEYNDDDLF